MRRLFSKLAVITAISIFAALFISAAPSEVKVQAYVLIESSTGTVINGENADKPVNVGYLSKLMTILLIGEDIRDGRYTEDDILTASDSVTGTKGSVIWLQTGDKLSVGELMKAVVVGNANDAVTVLAENSEGTIENFVRRMNSRAFDLGLRNTAFYSPYGYYDEREHSSAHDIALICAALNSLDISYFSIWRDFVRDGTVELVNENTLARTYERHVGFKAAHSDQSGYCIAEGGKSGDTCYISVILGAADEDTSFGTAKQLIRQGFAENRVTATLFPDESLRPIMVRKGEKSAISLKIEAQEGIVVPKGADKLVTRTVLPEYLTAPVKSGDVVGVAGFYCGKELLCESPIIAAESSERTTLSYVLRKFFCYALE